MAASSDGVEQTRNILIVDDSDIDRATYRRYLNQGDSRTYAVYESDCGADGLSLCWQKTPDVILLDYLLPDLDGLEFLQALQPQAQPLPAVIMLTGQGSEQVAVEAMKLGAMDYLVKGRLTPIRLNQALRRALNQQELERTVSRQQQQQQLMADISLRISQARNADLILETAVEGTRQLLGCDRTLIYRFGPDMKGCIMAESVASEWHSSLGAQVEDTCFRDNGAEHYLEGHRTVIPDIYNASLTDCHIKLLERFSVKANMAVPILLREAGSLEKPRLWGLMIAHQCRSPRHWQANEIALMDDLALQMAIAIQQGQLVTSLQERADSLAVVNELLIKTTAALETRNQELDEFAYIASHDLRSPLRAIANLALWLEEDLADQIPEENRQQLVLMKSRVNRMEGFINGLLDYSRAGRQSLETLPVDPRSLITEILDSLDVPETFVISLPDQMPVLRTQKILLQQVLENLIGNAIKYHDRSDGHLNIGVADQGKLVEFTVADDGPGIDPAYHERIFGVFQTLHSRDQIESTGIGLSIVKKLVEQQGGTIRVESEVGQGSQFIFTWSK